MTEKELYQNAMKDNLIMPAELSAEAVRNAKRSKGYVKTPLARYAAVAAAAAVAASAGTAYLMLRSDQAPDVASDIQAPDAASDIVVPEQTTAAAEPGTYIASAEPQDKMQIYHHVVDAVAEAPEDYYTNVFSYDEGSPMKWFSENGTEYSEQTNKSTAMIGSFLTSAEDVEYIGYQFGLEDRTVPDEVFRLFSGLDTDQVSVQSVGGTDSGSRRLFYTVSDGVMYLGVTFLSDYTFNTEEVCQKDYYFKVVSPDGNYPLCKDGGLSLESWATSNADTEYVMSLDEFKALDGSQSFTAFDAEGSIGFTYTVDMTAELPVVEVTDITVPEGIEVTDAYFSLKLDTLEDYGKNEKLERRANFTTGVIALEGIGPDLDPDEIVDVRLEAWFSTSDHPSQNSEETSCSIRAYTGFDRTK